jgi:cell division protein FtsI/penicillin-binding protein 2
MRWRLWLVRIFFLIVFLVLIANLYVIQVDHNKNYLAKAQAQSKALGGFEPSRGLIYITDKNGSYVPVVLNKEYQTVYAVPIEIEDPLETANKLSPIVQKDVLTLVKLLSKPKSQYALLIEKATDEQVRQLRELDLKGIYIKPKVYRAYPFGNMAAHVLGFISPGQDGQIAGRYGLELQFDDELKGVKGDFLGEKIENSKNGQDLYLTLDKNIQKEAEILIEDLNKKWNADGATMIVQDPLSGKILAMATVPTFDPNNYSRYDISTYLNPAVQMPYEPGSVFKVITMAAGIDSGKITPQTTYIDTGKIKIDKWTIENWDYATHGPYGKITMTNVIEHSLNLGSIFAQKMMGNDIFLDYVKKFGFGEKTNILLPGELKGNISNLYNGSQVNYATASFGQGITATPIQLISAFSAIANGGLLLRPLILADQKPEVIRRVISTDTASKVTEMMVSAVDVNKVAAISHYKIAGKTGTAYITGAGGYNKSMVNNTYIGFGPASNPKFTIFVQLKNPRNAPLAGQTVVPAFRTMAEFLINYYNIPPDRNDDR